MPLFISSFDFALLRISLAEQDTKEESMHSRTLPVGASHICQEFILVLSTVLRGYTLFRANRTPIVSLHITYSPPTWEPLSCLGFQIIVLLPNWKEIFRPRATAAPEVVVVPHTEPCPRASSGPTYPSAK